MKETRREKIVGFLIFVAIVAAVVAFDYFRNGRG